ncbi:Hpt domain-containing protein [Rhodobacter sp. KR11]|uniref:Hpt domain-containing protein n=1 Tax=Rhodobacter sp. KR11 TaxID=2974588 RepID=UPI0022220002|nr:Hpt domain-containing protein [Rhodobacter sp. KR11]MCW1918734.1 Hpt domain-containing protein [Rhodobacter sp. KR11]
MTSSTRDTSDETHVPPVPELDENVLLRLFELAGPVQTIEILDRLILDLHGVQDVLQAASRVDITLLRRQNHTLIGIAGTVGAVPLHRLALEAGKLLREGPTQGEDLVAGLRPMVARLIQRLIEMRAER